MTAAKPEETASLDRNFSAERLRGEAERLPVIGASLHSGPLPSVTLDVLVVPPTDPVTEGSVVPDVEVPKPRLPGLLANLLPIDPVVLEQGLRRFLETVQGIREVVPAVVSHRSMAPWLLLAGTTLVGCEIARRQVLRHVRGNSAIVHWPLLPEQPLFLEDQ
jgi:hypothetical protein